MVVDEMDAQVRAPIATIVATAQDSKLEQQMHYVCLVFMVSLFIFSLWRTLNSFFFQGHPCSQFVILLAFLILCM